MDWTAKYFDETYARFFLENVDEQRTSSQVDFIIEKTGIVPGNSIADIGCGLGRHVIDFARRGYNSFGYDFNENYIEKAKEYASTANVSNCTFIQKDSREFNEQSKFDLTTSLWVSFGYFDDKTNLDVLSRMAKSVKPGGSVLIDLENREYILRHYVVDKYRDREGFLILERNKFDAFTSMNKCTRTIVAPDGARNVYKREVRLYTLTELVQMGAACGIRFDTVFGDWDGRAYGLEVQRMILIGRVGK
ncbi:MAG: class I SAM-dependent methyltransferase [Caldiserica bacterium]|nr:class I SAM-dependent methyltransferase [Caldisericota bacterium]